MYWFAFEPVFCRTQSCPFDRLTLVAVLPLRSYLQTPFIKQLNFSAQPHGGVARGSGEARNSSQHVPQSERGSQSDG